jgi:hypothetical protein
MNNKELQAAIDSLLLHLRSGTSYTTDTINQLKALYAIQLERAKEYVE